jgi:hypothetical protein
VEQFWSVPVSLIQIGQINSRIELHYREVLEKCETWPEYSRLHLVPVKVIS